MEKLRAAGVRLEEDCAPSGPRPLEGKTLVITGSFSGYSREGLKSLLQDLDAKVASSVSRRTDCLLAGASHGKKLERARTRFSSRQPWKRKTQRHQKYIQKELDPPFGGEHA